MNKISDFLLRSKHWVIFLLLFTPMLVGQILVVVYMARIMEDPPEKLFAKLMPVTLIAMLSFAIPLYAWFWVVGSFLASVQQMRPMPNLRLFRFAVVFPLPYICLFCLSFQTNRPEVLLLILPLHFFAMFCSIYVLYFISRNLAQVETARRATFSDYIGYLLLMWLCIIGVWIIQPKINRLYSAQHNPA